MTGEKPPEKYEDCTMSVTEFERRIKEGWIGNDITNPIKWEF